MSCVIWRLLGTYIIVIIMLQLAKDSMAIVSSRYLSSYHVIFFIERYFAIAGGDRCTRASGRTSAIVDDLHIDYMPSLTVSAATTLEFACLCSWQWQTFVSPCMEKIGELTQFQAREISSSLCAVGVGSYLLSSLTGGMYISVCRAVR